MASQGFAAGLGLDEGVLLGGSYANGVFVWHTYHEFTLDFVSLVDRPSGDRRPPVAIVARVRIPTSAMFGMIQQMSADLDNYEARHGPIKPAPPEEEI